MGGRASTEGETIVMTLPIAVPSLRPYLGSRDRSRGVISIRSGNLLRRIRFSSRRNSTIWPIVGERGPDEPERFQKAGHPRLRGSWASRARAVRTVDGRKSCLPPATLVQLRPLFFLAA